MRIKAIHQFHPSCLSGDGVTSGMIFTRRLLRELGYESEIYCDNIPDELKNEVRPRSQLALTDSDLLLVHHSLGYENCAWLDQATTPKVLVYHNITPVHLLPELGALRALSTLGREQLKLWAPGCLGGIGDSEINSGELRDAGFRNVQTIPLLVDVDKMRHAPFDMAAVAPYRNAINLLFVGRIVENKHQIKLVEVLNELRHFSDQPVRLILAGGISSGDYSQLLEARIRELDLQDNVVLAGKVTDTTLSALYRMADAFVCMSEHEGFGMPLIESMLFDIPVLAQASSSIADTMGTGGMIFEGDDPRKVAALLHTLMTEPALRRQVLAGQRQNLQRFTHGRLITQLAQFLQQIGVDLAHPLPTPGNVANKPFWQIEGPFDSSYSLAIVNRELARAMARRGNNVGLRSMEGGGDFVPSTAFLQSDPECAVLARRSHTAEQAPDISLRFCYPPEVHDMAGRVRAMHSYGWEETGFPAGYVAAFNRRLDMVTVLSTFVEKILRDSGVRIPIAVTGGGVDHLLDVQGRAPALPASGFRFLHISSCFPRKGVDALLEAYGLAYTDADDVCLVIKTFPNPHNDVAQQLDRLRSENRRFPKVELIDRECSQEELVGLYQACDAFVAPSRGEGLGLPMAEAMLFKLPVITTAWGGQTDFCDETTAWLCDYRFAKSQTHFDAAHSVWAEPDTAHLAALLREVQQMAAPARAQKTAAAHQRIVADFTWSRVAERIESAVDRLDRQPLLRREVKLGWISSWHTRCGIASYSSFLSQAVPHDRLLVLANRTDERTETDFDNVLRCWNMGHRDNMDDVYDAILEAGIGAVVIQYNFGFFSLPALASLINRLADAAIAVHCFFHATADIERDGYLISLRNIAPALARAERLYVHGVQDLNRLKQFGLVDNVVFFPQGVLPTPHGDIEADKQTLGLAGKRILAAYGFLLPHKGIQHLIRAFATLAHEDASLHLLLVNALYPIDLSAQEKFECERLIDQLSLQNRVTLQTNFLSDNQCLGLLRTADLIVYPYQETLESSSAAVRMALAAGRPVAVTPLSIFEDVADVASFLPGADVASLTIGIRDLLASPAVLEKNLLAVRAWTGARQWPLLSARLLNTIDGLANPLPD